MKRVLFVDDDTNILAGLKRSMHGMRHEWEMEFIDDPQTALEAFRNHPFDIVVSDMKMPKKDGADLLADVKKIAPDSIRIILSGHSDPALIMKSVGPTHQYLAKPCEPTTLKKTIERTCALRELVGSVALRELVSGMGDLPSLPSAYEEIVACLQNPDASLTEVGNIVGQDVAMTLKILQLVNSAFFGIASPVAAIDQAVSFLGLETIGTLVLSHGFFSQYDLAASSNFDIDALWRYSSRCGALARMVAQQEKMKSSRVEEAFLSGMLHDLGKLVLATQHADAYAEVLQRAGGQNQYLDDIERDLLGATHGEVGAYLIGLWGLPDTVVEAAAYHDAPSACPDDEFGVFGVVHVASRLALHPNAEDPTDPALRVDIEYLQKAGVIDRWPVWQAACQDKLPDDEQEEEHAA